MWIPSVSSWIPPPNLTNHILLCLSSPVTCWSSVLRLEAFKTRSWPIKTSVVWNIWVPGLYTGSRLAWKERVPTTTVFVTLPVSQKLFPSEAPIEWQQCCTLKNLHGPGLFGLHAIAHCKCDWYNWLWKGRNFDTILGQGRSTRNDWWTTRWI